MSEGSTFSLILWAGSLYTILPKVFTNESPKGVTRLCDVCHAQP